MTRAQSGLEFIVIFSFVFVMFLVFFTVLQGRILVQQRWNSEARYAQLGDLIDTEVLTATRLSSGYRRQFALPYALDGEAYTVELEDQSTLVIRGASTNEYIRFLGANVTLVQPIGPPTMSLLVPTKQFIIIQKNDTGIFFRKDCVSAGTPPESCI